MHPDLVARSPSVAERETLLVHNALHLATECLTIDGTKATIPLASLSELRDFVVAFVRHHHDCEEKVLWPLLLAAEPSASGRLSALTLEHQILETALDSLAIAHLSTHGDRVPFAGRARRVRDVLAAHIYDEESLLLPLLRRRVSELEWRRFAKHVARTSPRTGAHLLVGLLDRVGSVNEREAFFRGLPTPLRLLVPLQRRRANATLHFFSDALASLAIDRRGGVFVR